MNNHYKNLEIDTFELWRKNKEALDRLIAAEFNIHKYIMRNKGCDYDDYNKIIAYAEYAKEALLEINKEAEEMSKYFRKEYYQ